MRTSAVAGAFYSADPDTLKREILGYLEKARPERPEGDLIGLISPHAGYEFSGAAAAYGFKLLDPERIHRTVVLAPSHSIPFRGVAVTRTDAYETPLGTVPVDQDAANFLMEQTHFQAIPEDGEREHSLEVQLPFLQVSLGRGFDLVPLLVGQLAEGDHGPVARTLGKILRPGDLVVVSSDFTHQGPRFGYVPYQTDVLKKIRRLDMDGVAEILEKDGPGFLHYLGRTGATICGAHPIAVLLELLPESASGKMLTYYTSADITGDETSSVSYVSLAFGDPRGWTG